MESLWILDFSLWMTELLVTKSFFCEREWILKQSPHAFKMLKLKLINLPSRTHLSILALNLTYSYALVLKHIYQLYALISLNTAAINTQPISMQYNSQTNMPPSFARMPRIKIWGYIWKMPSQWHHLQIQFCLHFPIYDETDFKKSREKKNIFLFSCWTKQLGKLGLILWHS